MLKLKDIFILFDIGTPLEKVALRGINLDINNGEIVTLVGNTGAGKSTLLQFLAGHFSPSFGRVWLDNRDITFQNLSQRSEKFTYVSYNQVGGCAENLTVAENLAVASMHHQKRSVFSPAIDSEMEERYYNQLKELDFYAMETVLDEKVYSISHLHKFMLSLLIAIMKNTEILLMDEQVSGLSRDEEKTLLDVTVKIAKSQHVTTIMAMSNPTYSLDISDRTIVLSSGQMVANLSGETKSKTKVEDLFASFRIIPKIKEARSSTL